MIDLPIQPAMATIFAQRAAPARVTAVAPVQDSSAAGQSSLQNNGNRQQPSTELQRHLAKTRHNDRLIGPPPSFQANVLEVEKDIKRAIDRLGENREKFRDREATAQQNVPNRLTLENHLKMPRK